MDPNVRKTQAAVMVATRAVAARFTDYGKGLHRRIPWPSNAPMSLRPHALEEIAALLPPPEGEEEDDYRKITRFSTAALLYSLERKSNGQASRLLRSGRELDLLAHVADLDAQTKKTKNESCSYCRIFNGLCYYQQKPGEPAWAPDIEPLSHEARTTPSYDPDTNISAATLHGQQWLVRGPELALGILLQAHPLLWQVSAPAIFQRSAPAREVGRRPHLHWETFLEEQPIEARFREWNRLAEASTQYIREDVTWPWNQDIASEISNIIRIEKLALDLTRDMASLKFEYALEECLQSSWGVSWERSGLDVDGGYYRGSAKRVSHMTAEDVKDLKPRDLAHLGAGYRSARERSLYFDPAHEHQTNAEQAVRERANQLQEIWKEEPWLVTASSTKRLRFTTPLNGPIEVYAALSNSAPVVLVNFLNQSNSLSPFKPLPPAISTLAARLHENMDALTI